MPKTILTEEQEKLLSGRVGLLLGQELLQKFQEKGYSYANKFVSTLKWDKDSFSYLLPKHAEYIEYGTESHTIMVKKKKCLAVPIEEWTGIQPNEYSSKKGFPMYSKNKKFVLLGKKVKHPGTQPQPIIRNTINTDLDRIIEKALKSLE
jgi:hypothetical protein